jgi:hypothetical protein
VEETEFRILSSDLKFEVSSLLQQRLQEAAASYAALQTCWPDPLHNLRNAGLLLGMIFRTLSYGRIPGYRNGFAFQGIFGVCGCDVRNPDAVWLMCNQGSPRRYLVGSTVY